MLRKSNHNVCKKHYEPKHVVLLQIARSIACVVTLVAIEGPLSVIQKLLGMVCLLSVFHNHFILKVVSNEVEVGLIT